MDRLEIDVFVKDAGGQSVITFGLHGFLGGGGNKDGWRKIAKSFLSAYLSSTCCFVVVETPLKYDWYTEFFCNNGVQLFSHSKAKDFVSLVFAPNGSAQVDLLVENLVGDEVFEYSDGLVFYIPKSREISDDHASLGSHYQAVLRPGGDGYVLMWNGPVDAVPNVTGLIYDTVERFGGSIYRKPPG